MIGVFGGTFDPVHLGHVELVKSLKIPKILICVAGDNEIHKKANVCFEHRFNMAKLAFENLAEVSDIDRKWHFSIDLLDEVQSLYPQEEIAFVTGSDVKIKKYYKGRELLERFKVIVAKRGSDSTIPPYSSTEIRENFQKNSYMLPEKVKNYILANKLYL
jgi:nicotinate-nucleotide adenylyltransferase